MRYPEHSLLVVGMAKPSREDAIYSTHGEFYISLVLCRETGEILDMGCNTIVGVTAEFVRQLLVGKRLPEDLPPLGRGIRGGSLPLPQKRLAARLREASNRFWAARGR